MSFTVDENDKEKWDWIASAQTLALFAPGMPLGTANANWNERTFIAARYLIYRDAAEPAKAPVVVESAAGK